MHHFEELYAEFAARFDTPHFPDQPASLYEPARYFLELGGKRIRPVLCLMGNELFDEISGDAWHLAPAVELFHSFTLIHDDIMDKAPLRRGKSTVHEKYGASTALLTGDILLVAGYEYLARMQTPHLRRILQIYNQTGIQVCEGQQLDMDYEGRESVDIGEYLHMIRLKTSVLLAACLQMGSILGGAGSGNQQHLYEFGTNLGIAFQVQDDYLDAFGDASKTGKKLGGDILAGKKTFLLIKAMEVASDMQRNEMKELERAEPSSRVDGMLRIFKDCGVDDWARELKVKFMEKAYGNLEDIAVLSRRKEPLRVFADFLLQREY